MKTYPQSEYSKKLLDPRWQKKRLEVLDRDNFQCQFCTTKTETLHVHHRKYFHGRDPWDIDSKWLVTLCSGCHELESKQQQRELIDVFLKAIKVRSLSNVSLSLLIHGIEIGNSEIQQEKLFEVLAHFLNNADFQKFCIEKYLEEEAIATRELAVVMEKFFNLL